MALPPIVDQPRLSPAGHADSRDSCVCRFRPIGRRRWPGHLRQFALRGLTAEPLGLRIRCFSNRRGSDIGIHPINSRSRDVIIQAIAADMLASHMSGLPVCPSAARSFLCISSDNIRSDLGFEGSSVPHLYCS